MPRTLTYRPTDEGSARAFLQWKYEPSYEIYNYQSEHFEEDLAYHIDPSNNIYSIYQNDELIGYCSFGNDARVPGGDYSKEALDIGLMIKPELTGQGLGSEYVNDVIQFARTQFLPRRFRVTILAANLRARRVWEKNGFQKEQEFKRERDRLLFIMMTRDA
jgi:RimJ/RimL family protein N-acetyltransferase